MELTGRLEFDHADRKDLYEYVEGHGSVRETEARRALGMGERAFGHHLAILKRDGKIEEVDGRLRVAFDVGEEETFDADGFEFTIRQAREEDLTGLVGAIRETIGSGEYVDAETVAQVVEHEGVLLRHNELESRMFFVATVNGEVVGWVHLKHPEMEKLQHVAELTVGVLEEHRGNGIGERLLERATEWARGQGFEKIYQSVPATNQAAIDYMTARHAEVEARRPNHYKIDGEYVDEVMLARTLD